MSASNPELLPGVESAGWISEEQMHVLLVKLGQEGVFSSALCARFGIERVGELQSEDFADALVFIGKNSKEKVKC